MPVSEEDILHPRDPDIKDSDEWPMYTLRKAKVLSKETGDLVSLLTAHNDHPVTVVGTLEAVSPDLTGNIKDEKYMSKTVELDNITNYAFAEYDDGTYGFWAAGKAGWYELKDPATAYKQAFNGMNEAASMFYMLADKVRRSYKTNWKLSAKGLDRYASTIFKDYLLHSKNCARRVDVDDVRDGFHEHREYLITCMLEAQEGLEWQRAPMFNYFKHKFLDTVEDIEVRMARNRGYEDPEADYEEVKNPGRVGKSSSKDVQYRKRGTRQAQPRTPIRGKAETIEISSNSEDEIEEEPSSPQETSRKRKSILQPKGSKYSKKATGRRRSFRKPSTEFNSGEDEDLVMEDASPLATAAPRATSQILPKTHSSVLDDYASHHEYLPRKYVESQLVRYKLPSTEPQGPGDIWTCTFEGCRQRVHAASTPDGKEKIKSHFREHAKAAQAKIDLALQESRPYLPVDNLVRRLQQFTQVSDDAANEQTKAGANDTDLAPVKKFPQRIKRSGY